jgi:hypothetical protein
MGTELESSTLAEYQNDEHEHYGTQASKSFILSVVIVVQLSV